MRSRGLRSVVSGKRKGRTEKQNMRKKKRICQVSPCCWQEEFVSTSKEYSYNNNTWLACGELAGRDFTGPALLCLSLSPLLPPLLGGRGASHRIQPSPGCSANRGRRNIGRQIYPPRRFPADLRWPSVVLCICEDPLLLLPLPRPDGAVAPSTALPCDEET